MDKPMTLSDAIRLGAMLLPQGFGPDSMYAIDSSCALAAACDAVGIERITGIAGYPYAKLAECFPILTVSAPNRRWSITAEIWIRNDSRAYTREAIADWVETLEKEQSCDSSLMNLLSASSSTVETS